MTESTPPTASDFVAQIIENDLLTNKHEGRVATRFPPGS